MTAVGAVPVDIVRLTVADAALARRAFAMLSSVFEEGDVGEGLGDAHLDDLLRREELWAVAAVAGGEPVGALTAHLLPMTRAETFELFIYDLAVRPDWQRRGVGRALVGAVLDSVDPASVSSVFVPADNADTHALDFYRAVGGSAEQVTIFTFTPGRTPATSLRLPALDNERDDALGGRNAVLGDAPGVQAAHHLVPLRSSRSERTR